MNHCVCMTNGLRSLDIRVPVADNCRPILPPYLKRVIGVIDRDVAGRDKLFVIELGLSDFSSTCVRVELFVVG